MAVKRYLLVQVGCSFLLKARGSKGKVLARTVVSSTYKLIHDVFATFLPYF